MINRLKYLMFKPEYEKYTRISRNIIINYIFLSHSEFLLSFPMNVYNKEMHELGVNLIAIDHRIPEEFSDELEYAKRLTGSTISLILEEKLTRKFQWTVWSVTQYLLACHSSISIINPFFRMHEYVILNPNKYMTSESEDINL